jgi:hypothetical protein
MSFAIHYMPHNARLTATRVAPSSRYREAVLRICDTGHSWQVAAGEGGTCTRGLRISSRNVLTFLGSASSPRVRLRSNEYSGFAVAPACYIAFAGRRHARPFT